MKLLTGNCVRYKYLMTQQKRHRDVVLAVLRKLRPVVRHEFVVVQPASVIITDRHDCVKRGSYIMIFSKTTNLNEGLSQLDNLYKRN